MLAAPSMANQPIPNQKNEYIIDDPPYDIFVETYFKAFSQPINAPFYPWIMVPVNGVPVCDEGQFLPTSPEFGREEKRVEQTN